MSTAYGTEAEKANLLAGWRMGPASKPNQWSICTRLAHVHRAGAKGWFRPGPFVSVWQNSANRIYALHLSSYPPVRNAVNFDRTPLSACKQENR
ncbi:MAG: hypothetical protein ACLRS8_14580 [Parabacteroides merdae]